MAHELHIWIEDSEFPAVPEDAEFLKEVGDNIRALYKKIAPLEFEVVEV